MTKIDWKSEITRLAVVKQSIAAADRAKALPWAFPNVAADEEQLTEVEQSIGQQLPNGYREFLNFANGWEGFCVLTDLFGTKELLSERMRAARLREDLLEFCRESNLDAGASVVIGNSTNDPNMFVMFHELPEKVVWICGDEVDRYDNFASFFSAMIAYNEQVLRRMSMSI